MSYTREQIEAIKKKLLLSAKKDTEFPIVDFVNTTDLIPLIHNGKNQTATIESILSLIDSPFTIIPLPNIDITQAIKLVPERNKRAGSIISFIDKSTKDWVLYQFRGTNERYFEIEDYWEGLFDSSNKSINLNRAIEDLNKIKAEVGQLELVITEDGIDVFEYDCKRRWVNLFPNKKQCIGYRDIPELKIVCEEDHCPSQISKPYRRGNSVYWINNEGIEEWLFDVDDDVKSNIDDRPIPEPRYEIFLTADPVEGISEVDTTYRWKILKDGVIVEADSVIASGQDLKDNPTIKYTKTQQQLVTITIDGQEFTKVFDIKVNPLPLKKYTVVVDTDDFGTYSPLLKTDKYEEGTTLSISPTPLSGFRFKEWLVNGSSITTPNYTFVVNGDMTILGKFEAIPPKPTFTLRTEVKNAIGGTSSPESQIVTEGSSTRIIAIADEGYEFNRWETKNGEVVSLDSVHSVTITEDMCFVAVFSKKEERPKPIDPEPIVDKGIISPISGNSYTIDGEVVTINNLCRIDGEGLEYFEVNVDIDPTKELVDSYEIQYNGVPTNAVVVTINENKKQATMRFYCRLLNGVKPVIKLFDKFKRWIKVTLSDFLAKPKEEEPIIPPSNTQTISIEFSGIEEADKGNSEFEASVKNDIDTDAKHGPTAEVDKGFSVEMEVETPDFYDIRRIYWKETGREINTGTIDNYVLDYSYPTEQEFTIVVEVYKKEVPVTPEVKSCEVRLSDIRKAVKTILDKNSLLEFEENNIVHNLEVINKLKEVETANNISLKVEIFVKENNSEDYRRLDEFDGVFEALSLNDITTNKSFDQSGLSFNNNQKLVIRVSEDLANQGCFGDGNTVVGEEKLLFTTTEMSNLVTKGQELTTINIHKNVEVVDCEMTIFNLTEELQNLYITTEKPIGINNNESSIDRERQTLDDQREFFLFSNDSYNFLKFIGDRYGVEFRYSFSSENNESLSVYLKEEYRTQDDKIHDEDIKEIFSTSMELSEIRKYDFTRAIKDHFKNHTYLIEHITAHGKDSNNKCFPQTGIKLGKLKYQYRLVEEDYNQEIQKDIQFSNDEYLSDDFIIYLTSHYHHSKVYSDFHRDTGLGLAYPNYHIIVAVGGGDRNYKFNHTYIRFQSPSVTSDTPFTNEKPKFESISFLWKNTGRDETIERKISFKKKDIGYGVPFGDRIATGYNGEKVDPAMHKFYYPYNDNNLGENLLYNVRTYVDGPNLGVLPGSFNGAYSFESENYQTNGLHGASIQTMVKYARDRNKPSTDKNNMSLNQEFTTSNLVRAKELENLEAIKVNFYDGTSKIYKGFKPYDFLGSTFGEEPFGIFLHNDSTWKGYKYNLFPLDTLEIVTN